jgi:hypothetical protein
MLQPVEILGLGFITRTILVSAHIAAFSNQNQDNNNNNNKDDIFGSIISILQAPKLIIVEKH